MLRVSDVAKRLCVSSATVYNLVAGGMLPCYRIGVGRGAIRFSESDVAAYLESCRTNPGRVEYSQPVRLKHLH